VGQKIHPIGFRIGVNRDWDSRWYADKECATLIKEDADIRRFVKKNLYAAGVSKVEIERAANKVKVTVHAAKPGLIIGRGGRGVDDLRADLDRFGVGKMLSVNVQEVASPETDAQLVAEAIAQQIEKRVSHKRAAKQAVLRAIRFGARGIRIRTAGRLGGAEMARIDGERSGRVPLHTLRADIDYGFTEAKTTYGNIGIKVWVYKGDILPGMRRQEPTAEEAAMARRQRRSRSDRPGGGPSRGRGGERRPSRNADA